MGSRVATQAEEGEDEEGEEEEVEGDEGGEGGSDLSAAAAGSVWPAQVSCCLGSTYCGYTYYDHTDDGYT